MISIICSEYDENLSLFFDLMNFIILYERMALHSRIDLFNRLWKGGRYPILKLDILDP
jgi:hypothetical protein